MRDKIARIITDAQSRMLKSNDPAHDIVHVQQVAHFAEKLARDTGLDSKQIQAVVLAAWWHDVARTITKNPSFIWMPFFDDLISACMLWMATIRAGLFGTVVGLATRIIFCKSLGTGAILTRLLMSKKSRILIDVIKDADSLDILNCERIEKLMPFVEKSKRYQWGYKTMMHWFLSTKQLHMRTKAARLYIIQVLQRFLAWAKQTLIFAWHVKQFGYIWCQRTLTRAHQLLSFFESQAG